MFDIVTIFVILPLYTTSVNFKSNRLNVVEVYPSTLFQGFFYKSTVLTFQKLQTFFHADLHFQRLKSILAIH